VIRKMWRGQRKLARRDAADILNARPSHQKKNQKQKGYKKSKNARDGRREQHQRKGPPEARLKDPEGDRGALARLNKT